MAMRKRKKYLKIRNRQTGKMDLAHRRAAATLLGRPLLLGEVVHHLDGDSTDNATDNLLVLFSQRFHAHIEHVLRQERRGHHLFQEMLSSVCQRPRGTLFDHIAVE
jgi:HNH endonuclease